MTTRTYSFDPECYKLAVHFLGKAASETVKNDLAQDIQNTVELSTQDIECDPAPVEEQEKEKADV